MFLFIYFLNDSTGVMLLISRLSIQVALYEIIYMQTNDAIVLLVTRI